MSGAFFFSFVLLVFCIHIITLAVASGFGKDKDGHFLLRTSCSAAVEKQT